MLDCYKHRNFQTHEFSNSISDAHTILSIPMYPELNVDQINYVVDTIFEFYSKKLH
jgi:dTDP-4-amino-4,6-dideoxygalactose transaminase